MVYLEHQHNAIITTTLIMFKQNGGLDRIIEILEIFWKEVQELPTIGSDSSQNTKETQQRIAHTYGGIKVILQLFSYIVSHKGVIDATQNQSLLTKDRERERGGDYFNPCQFLVELRYAVLPVVRRMWEGRSMEKTSSSIVKSIISILSAILRAEGESGAATKASPQRSVHLSWQSLEPNPEHVTQLREMGFTLEQSQSALVRFNGDFDRACDMLVSTGGGQANAASRSHSRPRSSDSPSSDEHTDTEMDQPSQTVTEPTAEPTPAQPPAQQLAEQPIAPATSTGRSEETRNERLVVMSIDHVISDNAGETSAAPTNPPTTEVSAPAGTMENKISEKKPATKEETPKDGVTIDELNTLREELCKNLVPNCLETLRVHDSITFDLASLIANSIVKEQGKDPIRDPLKEEAARFARKEITTTILESLLSLQEDEDFRKNAKIIASTAHLLGLLLQNQDFYISALDALRENISALAGSLKIYPGEPAHWVPHVLLILERILSEDAQPKQIRYQPPDQPEQPEPQEQIIDYSIGFAAKEKIFNLVMELIPNVPEDELLALAVARVTVILTRRRQLAEIMVEKGYLRQLFAMYRRQTGTSTVKLQNSMMYILHHIIEDSKIIKSIMRTEIRSWFHQKSGSRQMDTHNYIRSLHYLALRDPEAFVEVTDELCKHKRYEKIIGHMRYQQMCLKESEEFKPVPATEDVKVPEETTAESSSKEEKADPTIEDKGKEPDTTEKPKPAVEVKPPTVESPDGVVHFLCSELLALKDQSEPALPADDTANKDTEAKNPDGTSADTAAPSTAPKPERPEYKAVNNPVYIYRCFLLQCLTEILQSYNKSKIEFINFSRKASPKGPITPSKPRSGFLHYLLGDLIPLSTLQTSEDLAFKKKVTVSTWAGSVVVALATQTGEVYKNENEPDLVFVRKFLLESMLKAFKEASSPTSTESLDSRYSKLMALADLFQKMLFARQNQGATAQPTSAFSDSQKHIAKIMLDRNFIGALDNALAEIDFNFPSVRRAIKYVLRPLRILSKCALDLAESTETIVGASVDEDEISTASSLSDDDREETPDLYRNSALGMFEGEMQEDEEEDFDEGDEEEMYDDEMYDDDDDDDEGSSSGISDEDDENDAIQQVIMPSGSA
jgi:E3 ubiquitin-protein ligase HUWE1